MLDINEIIKIIPQRAPFLMIDIVEEKAPLHKNVTTKEVGDSVSFLFSNMSSAITGEVIHVDNGFSTVGV